jgi:hypothetical protein
MAKKNIVSKDVHNLFGLGIDFHKNLSKREEEVLREKKEHELIEKKKEGKHLDDKEIKDLYCLVCGAAVNMDNLSCEGCGMEFNMEENEARHMISMMIGLFWCDGVLDEAEQSCLNEYIEKIDVNHNVKNMLRKEVDAPRKLKNIIRWIKTPEGKRNTLRMAIAAGMVSKWEEQELAYLEEAKNLLNLDNNETLVIIKRVEEYLHPLME